MLGARNPELKNEISLPTDLVPQIQIYILKTEKLKNTIFLIIIF